MFAVGDWRRDRTPGVPSRPARHHCGGGRKADSATRECQSRIPHREFRRTGARLRSAGSPAGLRHQQDACRISRTDFHEPHRPKNTAWQEPPHSGKTPALPRAGGRCLKKTADFRGTLLGGLHHGFDRRSRRDFLELGQRAETRGLWLAGAAAGGTDQGEGGGADGGEDTSHHGIVVKLTSLRLDKTGRTVKQSAP